MAISSARLEARLPSENLALLKRAAEIEGRSLTDFVVSAASAAARKVIAERDVLTLAAEDQERFATALIDPPPLASALKRAIKRQKKLFV
jgi:uncharacterized protein (DUF1778 family)